MSGVGSLIIRVLSGERFRKGKPEENRPGAAALFPIALGYEVFFLAQKYFPGAVEKVIRGGAVGLWIASVLAILIGLCAWYLLWKYLSVKVLVVLAAAAWLVTFVTLFWLGIFDGNVP